MPATYDSLATTTVSGSSTSTITFSSISGSYTDLRIVLIGTSSVSGVNVNMRFNGDSATNYSLTSLQGSGFNVTSNRSTNVAQIFMSYSGYSQTIPSMTTIDVFSYASTSINKTCLITGSEDRNNSGSVDARVALYRSTSAITSVSLLTQSGVFNAGTVASLYGILRA